MEMQMEMRWDLPASFICKICCGACQWKN